MLDFTWTSVPSHNCLWYAVTFGLDGRPLSWACFVCSRPWNQTGIPPEKNCVDAHFQPAPRVAV